MMMKWSYELKLYTKSSSLFSSCTWQQLNITVRYLSSPPANSYLAMDGCVPTHFLIYRSLKSLLFKQSSDITLHKIASNKYTCKCLLVPKCHPLILFQKHASANFVVKFSRPNLWFQWKLCGLARDGTYKIHSEWIIELNVVSTSAWNHFSGLSSIIYYIHYIN